MPQYSENDLATIGGQLAEALRNISGRLDAIEAKSGKDKYLADWDERTNFLCAQGYSIEGSRRIDNGASNHRHAHTLHPISSGRLRPRGMFADNVQDMIKRHDDECFWDNLARQAAAMSWRAKLEHWARHELESSVQDAKLPEPAIREGAVPKAPTSPGEIFAELASAVQRVGRLEARTIGAAEVEQLRSEGWMPSGIGEIEANHARERLHSAGCNQGTGARPSHRRSP